MVVLMEKLKVLVVDDESRMRKLVKDFLTKSNYEVVEAEDGSQALDIFFESKDSLRSCCAARSSPFSGECGF